MRAATQSDAGSERRHLDVEGAVQGVGFRPFVYLLAQSLGLSGWVQNTGSGVAIEVQGAPATLEGFAARLDAEKPGRAAIVRVAIRRLEPQSRDQGFQILPSGQGNRRVSLLPDTATCAACLAELRDPSNRRHRYPFTTCTHCGPRFSVADALPFDRANTTMRAFPMCPACLAEYQDPRDRRFHAQLSACPDCGPQLAWWNPSGTVLAGGEDALRAAVRALDEGRIVAVKGVGGFQLMVDAANADAVARLRRLKRREAKPLAIMAPTLEQLEHLCWVGDVERALLQSPEAPIVLLPRRGADTVCALAPEVAPGNPDVGAMLPYTPMHHLLLGDLGRPVVATSGNLSDEPICTDERKVRRVLGGIADGFLVHNRAISRHIDDSVVRVVAGRGMVIRRARGYVPTPIRGIDPLPSLLAVGGHLKNTVAITLDTDIVVSQHIGDLDGAHAYDVFGEVIDDFTALYRHPPDRLVHDLHPDYRSTRYAEKRAPGSAAVQHHVAHVLACLADNGVSGPCLGVSWDGTGLGSDGTVWGGEWFHIRDRGVRRVGSLRPFRLPGGERAVEEPRRSALGLLHARYGDAALEWDDLPCVRAFTVVERRVLAGMLARGVQSPWTSSMGRLFDAVAALMGLCQASRFEGEAAMALEHAARNVAEPAAGYALPLVPESGAPGARLRADWGPLCDALLADVRSGRPAGEMAAAFHAALVDGMVHMARAIGEESVALSGGCFQNRRLAEGAIAALAAAGFRPLWHRHLPPNDGGLAVGQILAVARGLTDLEDDDVPGGSRTDSEHSR